MMVPEVGKGSNLKLKNIRTAKILPKFRKVKVTGPPLIRLISFDTGTQNCILRQVPSLHPVCLVLLLGDHIGREEYNA